MQKRLQACADQISWPIFFHKVNLSKKQTLLWGSSNFFDGQQTYGCFLQNPPKWSFLVGNPMVVGYQHLRNPQFRIGAPQVHHIHHILHQPPAPLALDPGVPLLACSAAANRRPNSPSGNLCPAAGGSGGPWVEGDFWNAKISMPIWWRKTKMERKPMKKQWNTLNQIKFLKCWVKLLRRFPAKLSRFNTWGDPTLLRKQKKITIPKLCQIKQVQVS